MQALLEAPVPAKTPLRGWPANPLIYEINTWVWLRQLSQAYRRVITLANVPAAEIEKLAAWRFDAAWLMGVWHRGPATRRSALNYLHEYRQALPDISAADVAGSAYAIRAYEVERQLGGRAGLAAFRAQLQEHGIKLILDYVPNHVATDHRWVYTRPEYFMRGAADAAQRQPAAFFQADSANGSGAIIARGRDPYFPPWIDTAQLNAFQPRLRQAVIDTLIDIGRQCDGVRCDMAMLMLNDVFAQTWQLPTSALPAREYWHEIIPAVRAAHPQMLFMAEVYWGLEHELQKQGFDYTYDKRMYDRLLKAEVGEIKAHLAADLSYLRANIRFIENHDEPRALETLGEDRQKPAATLICTLPGATLLHQGQLSGRRVKLPVQITRQAAEPDHPLLTRFYRRLLREVSQPVYRAGAWRMLTPQPLGQADFTYQNLIAYTWRNSATARLVVVNLSGEWSRAVLELAEWQELAGQSWQLFDALSGSFTRQNGSEVAENGLLLEVPPYGAHIFRFDSPA